jgi:hypothetical protein
MTIQTTPLSNHKLLDTEMTVANGNIHVGPGLR